MTTAPTRQLPAQLRAAQRQFDQWRASHTGRRRIPESLWAVAVKAARRFGINRTAGVLRVDYYRLKRRLVAADGERDARVPSTTPTFVQLPAVPATAPHQCVVQLEDRNGSKMRIELPVTDTLDVVALARSFWGA